MQRFTVFCDVNKSDSINEQLRYSGQSSDLEILVNREQLMINFFPYCGSVSL